MTDKSIDPTKNVIALVEANAEAARAMRGADTRYLEMRFKYVEFIGRQRAEHAKEVRQNDVERLAAIRQVDITNANQASASTQTALQALAKSTEDIRKTLADAMQNRDARVDERLGALERGSALGAGKQQVADPMMAELVEQVKKLSAGGNKSEGKSEGISMVGAIILGAVSLVAGLVGIGGTVAAAVMFLMTRSGG